MIAVALACAGGCATNKDGEAAVVRELAAASARPPSAAIDPGDYVVAAGDRIQITVFNHPDLQQSILVPPTGRITFPFIGSLDVAGATLPDLQETIRTRLAAGYIPDPQVSVNVEDIAGRKIYVLGEVNQPQVVYAKQDMRIIEAVSQAGGFSHDANRSAVLLIRSLPSGQTVMDALDLKEFLASSDWQHNPRLQGNDIVYVPTLRIASVERFFLRLNNILFPIKANVMEGIILYPRVEDALGGGSENIPVQIE